MMRCQALPDARAAFSAVIVEFEKFARLPRHSPQGRRRADHGSNTVAREMIATLRRGRKAKPKGTEFGLSS